MTEVRFLSRLAIVLGLAMSIMAGVFAQSAEVRYVYDTAGRLAAVIDPSGEVATYQYDAVGNLLSIVRTSSSVAVKVVLVSPLSGEIGASVTISGTGFSTVPSQNGVSFNGTSASVTSASTTQLVVTVPSGATTGLISVSAPLGAAVSSQSFSVIASSAPAISAVTPAIGVVGAAVSISGTNFDPLPSNDRVHFSTGRPSTVAAASPTALTTSVPVGATSGRIKVGTRYGTAVSPTDFFVPPAPYLAADVSYTNRIAIGDTFTVSMPTAGKVGLLVFEGAAGQRVSLAGSNGTFGNLNLGVTIFNPDGSVLAPNTWLSPNGLVDVKTLPVSGTYTILIDPYSTTTGSITLTLFNIVHFVSPITPSGAPVVVSTTMPGQNGYLSFTGVAGQRVSVQGLSGTFGTNNVGVSVLNPNGTVLAPNVWMGPSGLLEPVTLPSAGVYTVLVDPYLATTGSITMKVFDVVHVTGTMTPGGAPVTVSTTVPAQNALLSFAGTVGQRVSVVLSGGTYGSTNAGVSLLKPDGSALVPSTWMSPGGFIDVQTLPVNGTYTILVDPYLAYTGSITVALYAVPPDVTGTLSVGGAALPVALTAPGQNGVPTFSGVAGQPVNAAVTSTSGAFGYRWFLRIIKPDGTVLTSTSASSGTGMFLAVQSLPTTGTYTLQIDPEGPLTGSVSAALTVTPPPATVWASTATASSQYTSGNWSAMQATGAPNVPSCSDNSLAWAPNSSGSGSEWLETTFAAPAPATGVWVRETYSAGFIYRVDLKDTNDVYTTIWTGTDTTPCGAWFWLSFPTTSYSVKAVRIYTQKAGWEEIDAVGLVP